MRSIKRLTLVAVALVLVLGVLSSEAGLSFIGSVRIGGGSVTASGQIDGFDQAENVNVSMSVTGNNLSAQCVNKGGKSAPGRNPVSVNTSTSQVVTPEYDGEFNLHVYIAPSGKDAGCPNDNWTVTDLYGTIQVVVTATSVLDPADSISQEFTCTYSDSEHAVVC